jgi:hypothetical protein
VPMKYLPACQPTLLSRTDRTHHYQIQSIFLCFSFIMEQMTASLPALPMENMCLWSIYQLAILPYWAYRWNKKLPNTKYFPLFFLYNGTNDYQPTSPTNEKCAPMKYLPACQLAILSVPMKQRTTSLPALPMENMCLWSIYQLASLPACHIEPYR